MFNGNVDKTEWMEVFFSDLIQSRCQDSLDT